MAGQTRRAAPGAAWVCDECGRANSPSGKVCAECGTVRPCSCREPDVIDGTLAEVSADQLRRIAGLSYRRFLRTPRTAKELHAYARAHGYKPGWVWHQMREQRERGAPQRRN